MLCSSGSDYVLFLNSSSKSHKLMQTHVIVMYRHLDFIKDDKKTPF